MKVRLRAPRKSDASWLDGWLNAVAKSVGHNGIDVASLLDPGASARRAWIIEHEGEAAGIIVCRMHEPDDDSAIIELVATPSGEARRGSGMAAAALVERRLRTAGVRSLYAAAPAQHGIAVYFWIRLGYRPLMRSEWPCAVPGVAWMTRGT